MPEGLAAPFDRSPSGRAAPGARRCRGGSAPPVAVGRVAAAEVVGGAAAPPAGGPARAGGGLGCLSRSPPQVSSTAAWACSSVARHLGRPSPKGAPAFTQRAKPGMGESAEGLELRQLALQPHRATRFDQEVAQRHALEPGLAVADRIERRHLELAGRQRLGGLVDQRRDGAGMAGSATSTKISGAGGSCGMEEREAAAIGLQAAGAGRPSRRSACTARGG